LTNEVLFRSVSPMLRHDETAPFYGIVSAAPSMRDVFVRAQRVALSGAAVLIRGETGTGKELMGRALHGLSNRSERPFCAVNCAMLTSEMLASELFGHVRGAFTGAVADRVGLFQRAHRGTLFLDEVADIPLELQASLLRALESQRFVPLGGTKSVQVDVRVLSATHQSLRRLVDRGVFRRDLMYRIRVVPFYLPPLRERGGDVELLLQHFVQHFNQRGLRRVRAVDREVRDALLGYDWPGNVRELRNVVEHAFAVGVGDLLTLEDLPPELRGEAPPDELLTPAGIERAELVNALASCGGRRGAAAEALGMSRTTLWRKLQRHGL
jgi:two-component system, NtrC family, response regulator AtoC